MNNSVFIIAEAGSNWRMGTFERDVKMAKNLIDVAANAKADAIKFQTYKPETVYVPNAGSSDYLSEAGIKESIYDIFKDLSMPYEMIPILSDYCITKNIEFMSTPFSIDDARIIDPFVKKHKIASYEITHSKLIKYIAETKKPLILSTGGSTISEIHWAVDYFKKYGGTNISLLQNTSKYPTPFSSLNLLAIPSMIKQFKLPVGLSDHSRDPIIAPVAAVALGATIIEKHFTIDNSLPGPDHSFAILPLELIQMVCAIRNCENALGTGEKKVLDVELELRDYAQRGIQAIKNIKRDEEFILGQNIDILRSGKKTKGIHPKFLEEIIGKHARRNISIGSGIQNDDYEEN